MDRFRPNIVVEGEWEPFEEDHTAMITAAGVKMAKKFTRIVSQSTRRVLETAASTCWPATSKVILSPSFRPSVLARPDSSDTSDDPGASQRPCSILLDEGISSP
ncbi:hypothetical protein G6F65_020870 [Rhizopus arrhizus]|nr:hypothetical protein G6F65_020870 [Rhizopus arrhizus]